MNRSTVRIAAVQMVSGTEPEANLARARHWVLQAAQQGAQLVALPEYFCLMGQQDEDKLAIAEPAGEGPLQAFLSGLAVEAGVTLVGGTLPLQSSVPGKVHNSCLVFSPAGQQLARYDKLHLFGFDNGRERYDEGRVQQAGEAPVAFDWQGEFGSLRVGLSICYDLRFPELYRQLAPQLILAPSAFTHTTGAAHWELLLRTRAVENLAYVMAPAQGGLHANGRRTWGHSMVVDPWGQVLACLPEGEGLALAELDPARLAQCRSQLPALQHRKL
ncbi:carbon-nitrogen hydrolase family protein [Inhella sp.]|uniref:carbon-nitrogen hydrolase family protein n=1 Tax=Inhella sp. TaxID=1921806 RepID=UPI0035B10835